MLIPGETCTHALHEQLKEEVCFVRIWTKRFYRGFDLTETESYLHVIACIGSWIDSYVPENTAKTKDTKPCSQLQDHEQKEIPEQEVKKICRI